MIRSQKKSHPLKTIVFKLWYNKGYIHEEITQN